MDYVAGSEARLRWGIYFHINRQIYNYCALFKRRVKMKNVVKSAEFLLSLALFLAQIHSDCFFEFARQLTFLQKGFKNNKWLITKELFPLTLRMK